ncbi:MAG TPA: alpha/beta hydrolase [Devosia sp.]|jgi:acetyl esterase/lipase|uniref:alpha/beta hydrolase n=1 Tax=Devosia sp. TaxID=1871048 RepID=UPI002F95902E
MPISLFSLFNALCPKEWRSRKVASSIPYGLGERHRLDVYAPRKLKQPVPVVFFVYGGSWSDGDRRNYDFAGRAMAALGYVTVIADYRLVPEVEYPLFLEDCADAFAWTVAHIERYGGDPNSLALMGHSAGAYNAVMLALHPQYLERRGLLDRICCMVGLSGPYDFMPFDGPISLRVFGAAPDPMGTQPINHAKRASPPAFLASGDKDRIVYPRNTKVLAAKLRREGGIAVEKHYPSLGHPHTLLALSIPGRRLAPVLADVARFLRQYL